MNKYTARGLVTTADYSEGNVLVLTAEAMDVSRAFAELEGAVAFLGLPVEGVSRVNGRQRIDLAGGAQLRVGARVFGRAVTGGEDVVYFDYEPTEDEVASVLAASAARGPIPCEVVRP